MNNNEIAIIIRQSLKDSELTIREIEAITGVSRATINRLQNNPEESKLSTILKIFDILNIKFEISHE
ncbi:helix-turn-helix domain-containing protein [Halobacteriovorax sp.]|uniref:helix-turn-helix domain-containing protein n=1 Tax=Halobacteriovorax sp. TaxID=2020862 RepID=UPI00356533D3